MNIQAVNNRNVGVYAMTMKEDITIHLVFLIRPAFVHFIYQRNRNHKELKV